MLPRAERKATYAGWWAVVKKEAKHYWVGVLLVWLVSSSLNLRRCCRKA